MKQLSTRRRLFQFISIVVALTLMLPVAALAAPAPTIAPAAPHAEPDAPETGTISGTVFRDYNADGTQQTSYTVAPNIVEPGISGVIITAYDVNGNPAGSTTSGATGAYSFMATGSSGFRVEFTLPADGSLDFLQPGKSGPTTVVFVPTGGQTGLNVGFNNPSDYSQTNPPLVTTRTAFGPRLGGGGESALPAWSSGASVNANESVVGVAYTANGNLANSNAHNVYATLKQTGTLYGLIYQRKAKLILAGTFFKSFADTGPKLTGQSGNYAWLNDVDPLGAIYAVLPTPLTSNPPDIPAASNAKVYANLNKIKDPSTGLVVGTNPAGTDPRRDTANGINYDSGSFGDCNGGGAGGAPADGSTCWRHDPVAFMKVGTIGLGDLEEDDTEQIVYVVNLGDKKLYQLPIDTNSSNWPITTLAASPVAIPTNGCSNNEAVPGGLGFKDGKLYVGVTCTALTSQSPTDLKALVYEFNPKTQTFNTTPVFSANLSYPRGCIFSGYGANETALGGINAPKNLPKPSSGTTGTGILTSNCQAYKDGSPNDFDGANWKPWPQNWQQVFESNKGINSYGKPLHLNTQDVQVEYAVPWLSDISFDGNELVLGLRDTNGDRMGNDIRSPNITTNTALPTQNYVADGFTTQDYSSNGPNNNQTWNGNWTETGEATSPTNGGIQVLTDVTGSSLQLRVQGTSPAGTILRVQRTAWSGFSSGVGTLSFAYRRDGLETGDQVTVEVSTDGGSTWTTAATLAGPMTDAAYRTGIYDINLSPSTVVRFSTNAAMDGTDRVWFDQIRITNASRTWMSSYVYGSSTKTLDGAGFGDLLRACWNGSGWTLENNGTCGSVTTPGKDNGQGPSTAGTYPSNIGSPFNGYGEFYWDDSGPGSRNPATAIEYMSGNLYYRGHEQTMMGGTYQMPGWPDIAVTIADQAGFGDGGVARFSNVVDHPDVTRAANGNLVTAFGATPTYPTVLSNSVADPNDNDAGVALRHTQLYTAVTGFFGKANGLGDIEALSNSTPLELGNRLWCDNGVGGVGAYNGIQDPGEAGVSGVTVRLTCGAEYAEVATSGSGLAAGAYIFTDAIWDASANTTSTIIPRSTNCTISVNVAAGSANAAALNTACGVSTLTVPTVSNVQGNTTNNPLQDIRDSDATAVRTGGAVTSAQISVLTGGPGVNNHGLDFGFNAEVDFGDAPDPLYPTLLASNGARHTIVAGVRMGSLVDSEPNGQPNGTATGDDLATSDDEDGVTFSTLVAGQPAAAYVNMTGLNGTPVCYLNAWIDFNGNGNWNDAGEQIATNQGLNGGAAVQTVSFNVPSAVTTGPTYARFRCSTQQNLTPTGPASNGEVEDYQVAFQPTGSLDYGDAPDPTYPTLSASGGASHVLGSAGPRLGACVDAEANGQPNAGATGDDSGVGTTTFGSCVTPNDDEDGVTNGLSGLVEGVPSNLTIAVSNATCLLNAWIDFNGDGDWNDAGEQIASNAAMAVGPNTLPVTPPAASTQATTYARFRCNTAGGLGPTGGAADGEVEDYTLSIGAGSAANDWGDALDTGPGTGPGNYQTLANDNGAHHVMNANVYLGACVDAETNGQPVAGATGDDSNPTTPRFGQCVTDNDDEDGVIIPTLLAGQTAQLTVSRTAPNSCYLNGWIDFNADGDWNDIGEQVAANVALASGNTNLAVSVPGGAAAGTTYARFRCSTQQNLAPIGSASDGEVEDYAVTVTGTALDWGDLPDTAAGTGIGNYQTLASDNGASHALSGSAFMGKCVDAEDGTLQDGTATADDNSQTTPRLGACATNNDDEDGVTFSVLNAGSAETASIDMSAFNANVQVCLLNAWIDFNGDGAFQAGDQIATNQQMIGGAPLNVVNFNIPSVVTAAPTGARFRCNTAGGLGPTGGAADGEVEDYMVTISQQSRDFGDAPDGSVGTGVGNYNTTIPDNGPSHLIVSGLNLGNVAPDADNGTLQDAPATKDDTTNTDDEDSITTLPTINTITTGLQMTVRATNSTGTAATLACWIDFNRDGSFLGQGERSTNVTVPAGSGGADYTVTFANFGAPVAGDSYIRCRIAYVATEITDPTGGANSGEVEDFKVTIAEALDFGDAPDGLGGTGVGNYNTTLADNGPRHLIVGGLNLGTAAPDADDGTLQDAPATADDTTNTGSPDDEDGIATLPTIDTATTSVQMTVAATNSTGAPATLACWIDFNRDGDFTDTGERSTGVTTVPANSGTANYNLSFSSFDWPVAGDSYIRCRIAYIASQIADTIGYATSGEVEDYRVVIQPLDFGDAPDDSVGTGVDNYNTTILDNGPSHLIVSGLNLGNVAPDWDNGTLQDVPATKDDTTNTDDEDGITTLPTITPSSTTVPLRVVATNNNPQSAATLACWIDFNRDGDFTDAGEKASPISVPASSGTQNYNLSFTGFAAPVLGDSYIRCRIAFTPAQVDNPTGPAQSGEVEDFKVTITKDLDFGDLPDPSFLTLLASNGARHMLSDNLFLGSCVDSEVDGQPDPFAGVVNPNTGDDGNQAGAPTSSIPAGAACTDDEDGVTLVTPLIAGSQACIKVTATHTAGGNAYLYGWIDFNGDGDFGATGSPDAGEQLSTVAFAGGRVTLSGSVTDQQYCFTVPAGATFTGGKTHMRFRLTTDDLAQTQANAPWGGSATNGEVEDYYTPLYCVGNYLWNDSGTTANVQDAGDTPAADGTTVNLVWGGADGVIGTGSDDVTYATATTGGKQAFCGLPANANGVGGADEYRVAVPSYPAGMNTIVTANVGSDVALDSNGTAGGGNVAQSAVFALPSGNEGLDTAVNDTDPNSYPDSRTDLTIDFGFQKTTAITLSGLQAMQPSPWEQVLILLRQLLQPATR